MQYVSLPSVESDHTSLRVYHCDEAPKSLVIWIHGGGWVHGDRRRTRSMPAFFKEHNILFISVNYPLSSSPNTALIDLQVEALQGLNRWLDNNPLRERYLLAFNNIMLLSHSSGSHLVALTDKLHGWTPAVSSMVLMDSGAYDLAARFQHARPHQRQQFARLLGLHRRPEEEHESILRSCSPALLPPKPRQGRPLKVIIITSQRPGAHYSAKQLERSYQMPGYDVSVMEFPWSHEAFPDAIGADHQLNQMLLQAIAS